MDGTIDLVPAATGSADPLVSHTGVPLTRSTTFTFTLDVDVEDERHHRLLAHAGASRLAFNHHLGRVKADLDQRAAERTYGIVKTDLTPSLSWSKLSCVNEMNQWKEGRAPDARVEVLDDGTIVRGLPWRGEVSADVFETASVNAAQALKNWSDSREGTRAGKAAGFPRFKSRHRTTPKFRLRAKHEELTDAKEPTRPPVRPTSPRVITFPKLGQLRVRENTRRLRRLYERGRFHAYAATFTYDGGRWTVTITGVAAQLHHQRRDPEAPSASRPGSGSTGASRPSPSPLMSTATSSACGRG